MRPVDVKTEFADLLKHAASVLKGEGILIKEEYDSDLPYVSSSFINGREGIYFKVDQRDFLSQDQHEAIDKVFPIKLRTDKGYYRLNLLTVMDYDWDDDRSWEPSISVEIVENGKLI
jgi:hypothetical protein